MVNSGVFAAVAAMVTAVPASASTIVLNGGFEQPGGTVRDQLTAAYLPGWTYSDNGTGYDIY